MKKNLISILALSFLSISFSNAEIIPPLKKGVDERIRTIDYTRDVIKLNTMVGVSNHIEFGDDEYIEFLASGDDEAWNFAPKKNHLFIRPVANEFADTNLTVLTNKNTYHFVLVQNTVDPETWGEAWQDRNLIYSLKFKYPEEEAKKFLEKQKQEQAIKRENARIAKLQSEKIALQRELEKHEERFINKSYWASGDKDIAPIEVYDNGTFTFFKFEPNQPIPSFYSVNKHGKEAIVNTTMIDRNTIKVQGVFDSFSIRHGESVMCIDNRGFSIPNQTNTNTVSPNVIRQTKRAI